MSTSPTPTDRTALPNPRLFPLAAILASLLGFSACDGALVDETADGGDDAYASADAYGGADAYDAGPVVRWAPLTGPAAAPPVARRAPAAVSRASRRAEPVATVVLPGRAAAEPAAAAPPAPRVVVAPSRLLGLAGAPFAAARDAAVAAIARSPLASWTARRAIPADWVGTVFGDDVVLPFIPDATWTTGAARLVSASDGDFHLGRDLAVDAVPSGARAAVGARLRLLAVDGRTCEAVVSAIRVESRFTDRTALYWGDEDDEMGTRREDQTPEQLWDDGQPFLLGSLTPVAGDCSGAIFAQLASSPAPRTYAPVAKPAAAEKRAAIAAFRKLPAWKAEQASFVAEVRELDAAAREWVGLAPGVTPRFDTAYEGSPEVRFYVGRGGERFATVHARGQAGCGDPSGSLGVVFRVEGAGRAARFVPLHAESWSPELEGLVDLDGDGRPEGLRASDDVPAIFELGPENSDIRQQLDLPDHSIYPCPC